MIRCFPNFAFKCNLRHYSTASHILTSRDTFMDRAEVGLLVAYMGDALLSVDLPTPVWASG